MMELALKLKTQTEMTPPAALPWPWLRKAAVATHVFFGVWLLGNGILHEVAVAVKMRAGTLPAGANVAALLAVGAGLIAAGAAIVGSWRALRRANAPRVWPAGLALAFLGAVLGATALAYGFRFLFGSITLLVVDLTLLACHARANGRTGSPR